MRDRPLRAVPRPGLPAGRLRRLRLDPRPRGRRPPLRVPRAAAAQSGAPRRRLGDPARYRGVSFDRPPVSDMARRPGDQDGGRPGARATSTTSTHDLERRAAASGSSATPGTGKTTLAMLISSAALRGRLLGRDLLAAQAARPDPPDLRLRTGRRLLPRLLRAPDLGRPPPHRRPRRRETLRLGARAALRADQRALRERSARC